MPAAHMPPMPMPKSPRKANSITYEVEAPLRNANAVYQAIEKRIGPLRP